MNIEYFLMIFSISESLENSLHSGFSLSTNLVPLSKPTFSTVDTSKSPVPSETHLVAGSPFEFLDSTSTESATINDE